MALAAVTGQAQTYAQRLGYGPGEKLLIVHADDYGMCHAANLGTQKCLEYGLVTSASVMVPCPWFPEAAAYARDHPQADIGIHVTLTSEWKHYRWRPVSPWSAVPGLLDQEGFLWGDVSPVGAHAQPEEVAAEIRAQVERALAFGMKPTHLDTHMGTVYARPEYLQAYVQAALDHQIPCMIPGPTKYTMDMVKEMGISYPTELAEQLSARGMPLLDRLVTGVEGKTYEERKREYHEVLRSLKPGVTQIIIHPALLSPELEAIAGTAVQRDADVKVFTDPDTKALIEQQDIKLVTWRELGRKLRAG
jgi:predicted glycoside hydrolase/deacetylase ChbG (UPF0249 family)